MTIDTCQSLAQSALYIPVEVVHATKVVGTITIVNKKRQESLQLYDPMQVTESGDNRGPVPNGFKWGHVANTTNWIIASLRMMISKTKLSKTNSTNLCLLVENKDTSRHDWIDMNPNPEDWFKWRRFIISSESVQGIQERIQGLVKGCISSALQLDATCRE
jgi:hypothetical protein